MTAAAPSPVSVGLGLVAAGLLLLLLSLGVTPDAATGVAWIQPTARLSRSATTLLAAKGFGTQQRPAKRAKKPKEPETFLQPPESQDDELPIEKLPTTVFDHFNPGKTDSDEADPGLVAGLEILKYPNPRLRERSTEVTEEQLLSGEVEVIARKMFEMMYASDGMGLAAPQVGISKRIIVYNPEGDRDRWQLEQVLINPRIVSFSDRIIDAPEACLSFPKVPKIKLPFRKPGTFIGSVWRPDEVTVRATNLQGKEGLFKFKGWFQSLSRISFEIDRLWRQHEYDHLDGICWIDRLEDEERRRIDPFVQDLIRSYGKGGALDPPKEVRRWRSSPVSN